MRPGRRKAICAAIVKSRTTVGNEWLAARLAMGHSAYMSSLVNSSRRSKEDQKTLRKYDKI